jgi:hypothetical protein
MNKLKKNQKLLVILSFVFQISKDEGGSIQNNDNNVVCCFVWLWNNFAIRKERKFKIQGVPLQTPGF